MIPKVIHYCWFGGNPIPEEHKKNIESWKRFCPDYEIKQWDESNYDVSKCRYINDAYNAQKWAFVSDYARLDIVYENGGFYFDTDVELIKPIEDLREHTGFLGVETGGKVATGLGFGAEKGNLLIKKMRDVYFNIDFINDDVYIMNRTDPDIQTELLEGLGLVRDENMLQFIENVRIYPIDYFCPINVFTGEKKISENTYSVHYYSGSWHSKAEKYGLEMRRKFSRVFGNRLGNILYKIPYAVCIFCFAGPKAFLKKVKNNLKI